MRYMQRCLFLDSVELKKLQLILVILKLDVVFCLYIVKDIYDIIQENGFFFVVIKYLYLRRVDVEEFYKEYYGKFFYNRLVNFMLSGYIWVYILVREDVIVYWRKIMGLIKVFRIIYFDFYIIRGQFGFIDIRNVCYGLDFLENVLKEIVFFFLEFNVEKWYREDESYYYFENVLFCSEFLVYILVKSSDNKN